MIMSNLGRIFLSWRRVLQKRILPSGCTLKQHYLLNQLSRKSFMTPSEVAEKLYCDRPTASVIIKNLVKNKWIRKEKDPENGRSFRLYMTSIGHEKLSETSKYLETGKDPLACFNEKEHAQLRKLLNKWYSYIETI